ncbi:MazG-like family protein [Pseudomonas poae]|uniref:MazG-like family protein n=1 Tax=Pseudomonas poae TaxID=200451 RepID=UPI0030CFEADB
MRKVNNNPKIGDIVRYGSGSTALAQLTAPHAGGWHGSQCMGGSTYVSGTLYEPDSEDLATWQDQQRKQDQRYGEKRSQLSFKELRAANIERCNTSFFALDSKDGPWWGNAMAGECGEACNVVKKIDRDGLTADRIIALGKELADVVTYADLLAARYGIDLGQAVALKFNEVSQRVSSDQRLPTDIVRK